jgi:hypothetical protein
VLLGIEQFRNLCGLKKGVQGGFFLKKKPLQSGGFGVQQFLNRCSCNPLHKSVYNSPDIYTSKVVWAREMGVAHNLQLTRYYANRKV